jgi:hypothetical protein
MKNLQIRHESGPWIARYLVYGLRSILAAIRDNSNRLFWLHKRAILLGRRVPFWHVCDTCDS